jgi:hypothetical protein
MIRGICVPAANTSVVVEVRLLPFYLSVLVPCYVVDSGTSLQLSQELMAFSMKTLGMGMCRARCNVTQADIGWPSYAIGYAMFEED